MDYRKTDEKAEKGRQEKAAWRGIEHIDTYQSSNEEYYSVMSL